MNNSELVAVFYFWAGYFREEAERDRTRDSNLAKAEDFKSNAYEKCAKALEGCEDLFIAARNYGFDLTKHQCQKCRFELSCDEKTVCDRCKKDSL